MNEFEEKIAKLKDHMNFISQRCKDADTALRQISHPQRVDVGPIYWCPELKRIMTNGKILNESKFEARRTCEPFLSDLVEAVVDMSIGGI